MKHWLSIATISFAALLVWLPLVVSSSHWIVLSDVRVQDTVVGVPARMGAENAVVRPFKGTYTVLVRTFPENTIACASPDMQPLDYLTDAELPDPLDVAWWIGGEVIYAACEADDMVPGVYRLFTYRTIHNPFWFIPWPHKVTSKTAISNPYNIFPTEVPPVQELQEQARQIEDLNRAVRGLATD